MSGRQLRILLSLSVIAFVLIAGAVRAYADVSTPSQWVGHGDAIEVTNGVNLHSVAFNNLAASKRSVYGSMKCANEIAPAGPAESDQTIDQCWYETSMGKVSQVGFAVWPEDEPYAGWREGFSTELFPTLNPNVFIELTPDEDTGEWFFQFRTLEDMQFVVAPQDFDYPIFYDWAGPATATLLNSEGEPYSFPYVEHPLYSHVWYSANAEWMVIWRDDGHLIRISLQDFSVLTAQITTEPGYASGSITDDGRHVAVNVFGQPLRVVDLDTCDKPVKVYVDEPASCDIESMEPYLDPAGVTLGQGSLPIFYDDDTILFYRAGVPDDYYWEYVLRAPGSYDRTNYVALGDSYISGEGARNYYPSTDKPGVNYCHLSKEAYPYRLGQVLTLDSTGSIACSGARIKNIIGPAWIDNTLRAEVRTNQYIIPSNSELGPIWTPGYFLQNIRVNKSTDIVMVSIGGNDIGFETIITNCVRWVSTCYTATDERRKLVHLINEQYHRLVNVYKNLRERARPGTRVYVIGYPKVIKAGGDCGNNVKMNANEIAFAVKLANYLNSVIERASAFAGVEFVDISEAFAGQRLCETNVPVVHGLNTGFSRKLFSNESFHPTVAGHAGLVKDIGILTDWLKKPMPRPDPAVEAPNEIDAMLYGLLDIEEIDGGLESLIDYFGPLEQDVIIRGEAVEGVASSNTYGLAPNQPVEVSLTSDPVFLGVFMSDGLGAVPYSVLIPADTEPGWHTLHFTGVTAENVPIDIQQNIYVAASADDWDGDGVKNVDSPCQISMPDENTGEMQLYWCGNPFGGDDSEDGTNIFLSALLRRNNQTPIITGISNENPAQQPGDDATVPEEEEGSGRGAKNLGFGVVAVLVLGGLAVLLYAYAVRTRRS